MTWDPTQYLRFGDLRARPAIDLLNRVPAIEADEIWDLGCGTGEITAALRDRWPRARVHGLDASADMLAAAANHSGIDWILGDIAAWSPQNPVDLIYSNAALHWLGDHAARIPGLIGRLRPGGVLAVQMPRNHSAPSHQVLFATARGAAWSDRLGGLVQERPVAEPTDYYALTAPLVNGLDVWETVYLQQLAGADAVAHWAKGSVLRPYLEALGPDAAEFFGEYAAALRSHYPVRADGTTLLPFRRLFIVAVR